ncbi:MAG: maleylacetoacetate isomerase [Deltaproteobacteria bacterium]|nr:maleylacetoacetate isomerase [Deltaproteobacteria bacterium]
MQLKLYHYWRSSSSWRVRWAFAIKKMPCAFVAVDLLKGEQKGDAHLKRNPSGHVPVLEVEDGGKTFFLTESLAIIEWMEEIQKEPSLLPGNSFQRARIRALSEIVNSGTQPVQNLKVQKFHSSDPEKQKEWTRHWIREGLSAYENLVKETAGKFSVGDTVTMADLFLIPQCYNAKRFDVPLSEFSTIARIDAAAFQTSECQASAPDKFQP